MPPLPKPAAAHRNIDVVAKPGRLRNVPTPPELGNRQRVEPLIVRAVARSARINTPLLRIAIHAYS